MLSQYVITINLHHLLSTPLPFYTALKALQQRQAELERVEQEALIAEDELSRLQRGLVGFLEREGEKMNMEMHDARRYHIFIFLIISFISHSLSLYFYLFALAFSLSYTNLLSAN